MNGNRKRGRVGFAPVVVGIVLAGAVWDLPVRAGDDKASSHLIFVRAEKEVEAYDDLAKCEQLTVEKYKELGVQVTEVTSDDLRAWLKEEGKPFAKGNRKMQLFHLTKAKGAQAFGGLATLTVQKEEAVDFGVRDGVYFYGWGVSLAGVDGTIDY